MDIYIPPNPKHQNIDGKLKKKRYMVYQLYINNWLLIGAHFGTTFPHLFFQTFPDIVKKVSPTIYTARLFGFRIHHSSLPGSRMQWLRIKQKAENNDNEDSDDKDEDEEEDITMLT